MTDRDDFAWAVGRQVRGPASLGVGAALHEADGGADEPSESIAEIADELGIEVTGPAPRESIADAPESIEGALRVLALRLDAEAGIVVQVRAAMTALEHAANGARNAGQGELADSLTRRRIDVVRDVSRWMDGQ